MKQLSKDTNGFVQGLLMNPWVILVLVIALVIGLAMGGLALLYAPNIAAAVLIAGVGVFLLVRSPFGDIRARVGIPAVLIALALVIYFYGNEILAVVA